MGRRSSGSRSEASLGLEERSDSTVDAGLGALETKVGGG